MRMMFDVWKRRFGMKPGRQQYGLLWLTQRVDWAGPVGVALKVLMLSRFLNKEHEVSVRRQCRLAERLERREELKLGDTTVITQQIEALERYIRVLDTQLYMFDSMSFGEIWRQVRRLQARSTPEVRSTHAVLPEPPPVALDTAA